MRGVEAADDFEAQAMNKLNTFYKTWETRLSEQGLIGSKAHYEKFITGRERRIEGVQKRLETARNIDYRMKLEAQVRRYSDEVDEARAILDDITDEVMPANEKIFRPRYWNQDAIKANRVEFERILTDWYRNNPSIVVEKDGKFSKVQLSTDPAAIKTRVDDTIDNIIGIKDILDPEAGYYGAGKSKHFKHH